MKQRLFKIAAFVMVLGVMLLVAEALLRAAILPGGITALRRPWLYADPHAGDDYWKLQHRFGGRHKPPENPHPLLGWVGHFSRDDYRHRDQDEIRGRRPVLLYGDSFAQCVLVA